MKPLKPKPPPIQYATVPKLWPGETIACLAGGTLPKADVDLLRGRVRVIAIKDAIRLAPWADVLYSGETKWWKYYGDQYLAFPGLKYSITTEDHTWASVLRNTGESGLELDPSGLRTGKNSGYQAINLAVHLGATRILLLGYDMQPVAEGQHHWHRAHPWNSIPPYAALRPMFDTIVEPLRACGVEVLNVSRVSVLTCFPRVALEDVFAAEAVA